MIDFEKLALAGEALSELKIATNSAITVNVAKNDVQIFVSNDEFWDLFNGDYKVTWTDRSDLSDSYSTEKLEHPISPITKICTFRHIPHAQEDVIERLISKIDDLMERETNTERREGMYDAYHEILKVRC